MKKKVTLKDVAEAVGVHVSTVSRALDPKLRHLITPKVADRILKISQELNYRPNASAYSLRTNRSRTVGVVVPDITNPIFPPIIRGIEDRLSEEGYLAVVANTDSAPRREATVLDTLLDRGVDGLIIASVTRSDEAIEAISKGSTALVTVNRRLDSDAIASVVHDEEGGMAAVVRHLSELGHVTIGNVAGPQTLSTGHERLLAFKKACRASGLTFDKARVAVASGFSEAEGARCAEALLAGDVGLTAIVCSNDRLAVGALDTLRSRGLSCPDDISITGYNDMPMVDRLSPPLTTVRIQQYEVGRRAAGLMLAILEGERQAGAIHEVLPVELMVRGSTAPPKR